MMEQINTFLFLSKTRHQIRNYKLNSIYLAKLLRESQRESPQSIPGGAVSGTFLVYSGVCKSVHILGMLWFFHGLWSRIAAKAVVLSARSMLT